MSEFDDQPRPRKDYPTPASKMSKVPSWVSVGFVLGALFVLALPKPKPVPPQVKLVEVVRPAPQETKLTTIEAVFAEWGSSAVWSNDTTEIAYWNPGTQEFSEFYEVWRIANRYYFRSIPRLTRKTIVRGQRAAECPLQFTETDEQYREWFEQANRDRLSQPLTPRPAAPPPKVELPVATPSVETPPPRPGK